MGRFLYTLQLKLHEKVIRCITVRQEDMLVDGKNLKITDTDIFYGICSGIHFGSRHTILYLTFFTSDPHPFSRISNLGMTSPKRSKYLFNTIKGTDKELGTSGHSKKNASTCFLLICFFFLIQILLSFP